MPLKTPAPTFWITNISKKAVNLSDLATIIYPMSHINLLDKKHYSLTIEQITSSQTSGSLFRRKKQVVIRQFPPDHETPMFIPFDRETTFPTKHRSTVEPDNTRYEELDVSDEEYASDNSDTAETDHVGKWKKLQ
jgi:hypothetical protein